MEALKIGVIGEVPVAANEETMRSYFDRAFSEVSADFPGRAIAVVGYGHDSGLIGHAYYYAVRHMLTTVGIVVPGTALENFFPVTYTVDADPRPTDLMRYYFKYCDVMIRIGGDRNLVLLANELADQERTRLYQYDA